MRAEFPGEWLLITVIKGRMGVSSTIAGVNKAVGDTAKGIVLVKTRAEDLSTLSE